MSCPIEDLYRGSPQAFEEIICILLENAIVHAFKTEKTDARIQLFAHVQHDQFYLHYEDNGCGIQVSPIDRIFDPLYKGSLSSQGEGMGLFRARQLANDVFDGDLTFQSIPEKGVIFKIEPKSLKKRERGGLNEEN